MELHEVRYAVEALRQGGFAAASRELYVSRQAVSQAVRHLESQMGGPLFVVANGNRLLPTELGRRFLNSAEPLVQGFDDLEREFSRHAGEGGAEGVSVVISTGVALSLGDDFFERVERRMPALAISVEETNTDDSLTMLADGGADLALVGSHPSMLAGFESRALVSTGLWLAVPLDNPLSARDSLQIEDLDGQTLITAGLLNHLHQFVMRAARERGVRISVPAASSNVDMLRRLALKHDALSFVFPLLEGEEGLPWARVVRLDMEGAAEFGTYAVRRRHERPTRSLRMLWELVAQVAREPGVRAGAGRRQTEGAEARDER